MFGGEWEFVMSSERWEISFELPSGDRISVNVFHKLEKRFEQADSDSISDLFDMIKKVYLEEASFLPPE